MDTATTTLVMTLTMVILVLPGAAKLDDFAKETLTACLSDINEMSTATTKAVMKLTMVTGMSLGATKLNDSQDGIDSKLEYYQ